MVWVLETIIFRVLGGVIILSHFPIDLTNHPLKKKKHILPNPGDMVIYHKYNH